PPTPTPFPYTTLFRSYRTGRRDGDHMRRHRRQEDRVRRVVEIRVLVAQCGDDGDAALPRVGRGLAERDGDFRRDDALPRELRAEDRKSTRLNSSHLGI